MVDTISNMQLADLKYKLHGGKIIRNIIYSAIGAGLYPTPGSEHYRLICLDQFHWPSHINRDQEKKIEIKMMKFSNARNSTTNTRANYILRYHALFVSFIFVDMKIQMIPNHPGLSVLISFIFADTNNQMIVNHFPS